ncbi:hypothetical protein ACFLW4_07250 [Chloroflexota bacterium]
MAEKEENKTKSSVLALDLGSAFRMLLKAIGSRSEKWIGGKVVTLDIDSTSIRLLETKGGVVKRWADISFEPSEIEGEEAAGERTLGKMVRQLMASSGIKAKKVVVSVSGLYSVSRILLGSSLLPAPTTAEAILDITREIMPLSESSRYLSWQTIKASEGESVYLIIGVAREVMDNEMRALKAVGINPDIVELKAMALTRITDKKQALILNIEPSSFDVIVVNKGIPEIMRTIPWRRDSLTEEDAVEHLAMTLEVTADFYNSHHIETPLDPATPLFVTGPMSIALADKLKASLDYPVEPLTPPLQYPGHLPVSQYAVNIGLALRGTTSSGNNEQGEFLPLDINLLPESYRPWRLKAKQLYSFMVIIAALALLFPLFQMTSETMGKTASLQAKFDILNNQLTLKGLEIQKREPLQKAIGQYRAIVDRDENFTENMAVIMGEAGKLGIMVEGIERVDNSVMVSCHADDYLTFRKYLAALEESGRFATPIPPPEGYPYTSGGTITLESGTSE